MPDNLAIEAGVFSCNLVTYNNGYIEYMWMDMTGEKLSLNYLANMDLLIGQFVHPVGGEGMG